MNRRATLAAAFLLLIPTFVLAGTPTRRYLVATRGPAIEAAAEIARHELRARGFRDILAFREIDGFAADLTDEEAKALARSPRVRYVEPDGEVFALADTVTAGSQTTPYGVQLINAPKVWPVTRGASANPAVPIRIAVIDTGIRYDDPELRRAYRGGRDFVNRDDDPLDDNGHGTHVAGTVAALNDNAGVVGVAPDAEVYSLKVLDQCGSGSQSNTIAAVDWVIQKKKEIGGNWIMSLSLGSSNRSTLHEEAFRRAADAGILTFAASGNGYDTNPVDGLVFPAGYPTVVSVGAVDDQSKIANFSQRGAELDLVAPGVDVLSTTVAQKVSTDDGRAFVAVQAVAKQTSNGEDLCLPSPEVSGPFVFCGFGGTAADFPPSVSGKIALIERGNSITFAVKMKNAKAAGAIGVILFNNVPAELITPSLGDFSSANEVIPTVFLSQEDGRSLLSTPNARVTVTFGMFGFTRQNGTSMATPHASAAAALLWSLAPEATAEQIKNAMINTATDLGEKGFDTTYGFGLVNVLEAAKQIAPSRFTNGPVAGRRVLKRG